MPPLDGPRAMLCVTRYPSNAWIVPSSIVTGIETTTAFLHSCRTFTRRWSMSKMSATRRSCSRAIWNGFSRRWDSGASSVVTEAPRSETCCKRAEYRPLLDAEPDRLAGRPAVARGVRDQPHLIAAGLQDIAARPAPGEADRNPAGQEVAQAGEQADLVFVAPELDVELRDRVDLGAGRTLAHEAGLEREHRGGRVGRLERVGREGDGRDQALRRGAVRDRPRDPQRAGPLRDEDHRAFGGAFGGGRTVEPGPQRDGGVAAGLQPHPARLRRDHQAAAPGEAHAH